ncbi:MAG: DUF2771 family protein [Jatrophihabitantaceae bacterium]
MRVPVRLPAVALSLLGSAALLTGCGHAEPTTITVLSHGKSTAVRAQPACTMLKAGGCNPQADLEPTIEAVGGSQLQVRVPKKVASGGWIATAYTSDGKTNTPLTSPTGVSTGIVQGTNSYLLNVPPASQGSYYLQVTALRPTSKLTNWLCLIKFGG